MLGTPHWHIRGELVFPGVLNCPLGLISARQSDFVNTVRADIRSHDYRLTRSFLTLIHAVCTLARIARRLSALPAASASAGRCWIWRRALRTAANPASGSYARRSIETTLRDKHADTQTSLNGRLRVDCGTRRSLELD